MAVVNRAAVLRSDRLAGRLVDERVGERRVAVETSHIRGVGAIGSLGHRGVGAVGLCGDFFSAARQSQRLGDCEEVICLVGQAVHTGGAGAGGCDAQLGAGVAHGATLVHRRGGRGVSDVEGGAVLCAQRGGQAVVGRPRHDLARVGVVSGHDDERVGQVHLGEGGGDGLVEVVGFADLAAGVGVVVLLVDRGALDLQEVAVVLAVLVVGEQVDGLGRHVSQGCALVAEPLGVGGAAHEALVAVLLASKCHLLSRVMVECLRFVVLRRHVAGGEQAEHGGVLVRFGQRGELGRILEVLVAAFGGLFLEGLSGPLTGLCGLVEVLVAAAERHIGASVEQLLGDGADAAILQQLFGVATLLGIIGGAVGLALRAVAGALRRVGFHDCRGRVLDFGGGHVAGCQAFCLGELEEVHLRGEAVVDRHSVVVGLGARCPA